MLFILMKQTTNIWSGKRKSHELRSIGMFKIALRTLWPKNWSVSIIILSAAIFNLFHLMAHIN